ncbi:hypothetical protein D3C85_223730 [compost metagenome]
MSSTTSIAFTTVNRYAPQAAYPVGNPVSVLPDEITAANLAEHFCHRKDTLHDRVFDASQENRLQFVITHMVSQSANSTLVYHLFGYSDHDGNPELLSDDMKLYFSRAVTIRSTLIRDITGCRTISNVVEDALLTQGWLDGARVLRPSDIFQNLGSEAAFNAFITPGMKCINLSGAFNKSQVKMMHTSNESPARYIKTISDALHGAIKDCIADPIEMKDDYLFSAAMDRTCEPTLMHHWFLSELARSTKFEFDGFVTLGDFKQVFEPETVSAMITESVDRTDLTPWTGSVESYLANLLINTVNASMTDYGYMSVRVDGVIGKVTTAALNGSSMLDKNAFDDLIPEFDIKRPPFVSIVKNDLKAFVWNSADAEIQFNVKVDIAGVATVTIIVGDEAPQIFERPMYMVGMLSGQWAADETLIERTRAYFKDAISVLTSRAVVHQ